jgi:exosome complex component RRP40
MTETALKPIVVLPGDDLTPFIHSRNDNKQVKLGPGVRTDEHGISRANVAGTFQNNRNNVALVQSSSTARYLPQQSDRILGIVEDRLGSDGAGGDFYKINIGASHPAVLSNLAFEGATKRNKPQLLTGQVLYLRVEHVQQHIETKLSCLLGPHDGGIPRKDWMTNEGAYGILKGGTLIRISTGLARELLHPQNVVLAALSAAKLAFEVAIGVNGFLWIHSTMPQYTILIQNTVLNSQVMTEAQVRAMVKSLVYNVEKQLQREHDAARMEE